MIIVLLTLNIYWNWFELKDLTIIVIMYFLYGANDFSKWMLLNVWFIILCIAPNFDITQVTHMCNSLYFFQLLCYYIPSLLKYLFLGCVKHITILALIVFTYIHNYNLAFESYTVLLYLYNVEIDSGMMLLASKHSQYYLYMNMSPSVFPFITYFLSYNGFLMFCRLLYVNKNDDLAPQDVLIIL